MLILTVLSVLRPSPPSLRPSLSPPPRSVSLKWTLHSYRRIIRRGVWKSEIVYKFAETEECGGPQPDVFCPQRAHVPSTRQSHNFKLLARKGQILTSLQKFTHSGNILALLFLSLSLPPSLPPSRFACVVAHEHLKERGLFGLPPPPPGANPADYYHQMTLMATHPSPYGDLLMQSGGAASAMHLHDYLSPVDGE